MSTVAPLRVKAGVAGAGVFGGFHARKLFESERAELAAVFDAEPERAMALARQFSAQPYTDYADFLAAVDALIIAAPAAAHGSLAIAALERGRHVYVEKPIALDPHDAARMNRLARQNACVLQVGHQERFVLAEFGLPRVEKQPHLLEFVRTGPSSGRCEEVSVAIDLMIHDLDLMGVFGFKAPLSVAAAGDAHEMAATLTFSGGAACRFLASRRSASRSRKLIAHYDDGRIEIDFIDRILTNTTGCELPAPPAGGLTSAATDPLKVGVEAFLNSILTSAPVAVTGEAGAAALDLALAIENSVRNLSRGASPVDVEGPRSAMVMS